MIRSTTATSSAAAAWVLAAGLAGALGVAAVLSSSPQVAHADEGDAEEGAKEADPLDPLLEEVIKGKPRHFVLVYKGTKVVHLVLFKKGNVEKQIKLAKKDFKGTAVAGICVKAPGKGTANTLVFQISNDDAQADPVKTLVLKKFIRERTERDVKVEFEFVDPSELPDVPE